MKHTTGHRNTLPPIKAAVRLRRFTTLIVACALALSLSACLPSGEQEVNTDLFKDKTEMATKSSSLRPGMTREEAFATIGVPQEKFEKMSMQEVQTCYYGNSTVEGSPEQLEQFRARMMRMDGYYLPYSEIKSSSSLGFGKMKVEKSGYNLRLVMVFERDRLIHSVVEGTQNVRMNEDRYMWDSLINRGIGAAF